VDGNGPSAATTAAADGVAAGDVEASSEVSHARREAEAVASRRIVVRLGLYGVVGRGALSVTVMLGER
jgi:hypothetical protein